MTRSSILYSSLGTVYTGQYEDCINMLREVGLNFSSYWSKDDYSMLYIDVVPSTEFYKVEALLDWCALRAMSEIGN